MSWLFPTLLIVIFLATVLCLLAESMWSNAIRFLNVVMAAMLATNFWEPTAKFLENSVSQDGSYWWDFLSLWVLFALFITILQTVTNKISKVNVRFLHIANKSGGIVFACLAAAVLVSFTNFTIHTAPLAEVAFKGGFDPAKPVLGQPDRMWMRFMMHVSGGSLAKFSNPTEFEPVTFSNAYADRRRVLQEQVESDGGFKAGSVENR